jgi:hypothetical protein
MSSNNAVRAAICRRIFLDQEDDHPRDVRQEADRRSICAERGSQVIEPVYCDNDISASQGMTRASYERVLADIDGRETTRKADRRCGVLAISGMRTDYEGFMNLI